MFIVSYKLFRYRRTYATLLVAISVMNILAHLQSSMLGVYRPTSGHILPTIIGVIIGLLLSCNRVSFIEKSSEQKKMFINIVQSLSIALDERDAYTYGHSSRVTALSIALGKRINLDKNRLEMLEIGSILHDIGKIGIPDTTLNKPERLSNEEIETVKQHPIKGERIISLSRDRKLDLIVSCIRSHHERYDGAGYPDGLAGESIPVLARIVSIADSYDAMTSSRPYQAKMTAKVALKELLGCSGNQFDPQLVHEFTEMLSEDNFQMATELENIKVEQPEYA